MTKQTSKAEIQDAEVVEVQKHTPAVQTQSDGILAVIERVATDPNADIAKLEKMLEMKERLDDRALEAERREAQRRFYAALTAAQREVPVVVKNRQNDFNKSTFADLAAIEQAAMPKIREHGFNISARSVPGADQGFQRVQFRVAHESGHVDEFEDDYPLDNQGTGGKASKTAIQAKGSTVTYARRYMLCGYFNIAIADNDGQPQQNNAPAQPQELTATQAKRLRDLVSETETDEAKFLKAAKADSIETIKPVEFKRLESLLLAKKKQAAAAAAAAAKVETPAEEASE